MNARQTNSQSLSERARQDYGRPDAHPFRVGETYANRLGKYEVVGLAPPRMTIRYEDGAQVTADIVILARIWANLQMPPEKPEPGVHARATSKSAPQPVAARRAVRFPGLTLRDFAPSAERAAWRAQWGLRIANRLTEITGVPHKAFPAGNRAELYIGREHHFSGRSPEHRAKFLFRLTPEAAEYGFHVERDFQKMDLTWDWRRFISALHESEPWGEQVRAAMRERGLEAAAESFKGSLPHPGQELSHVGGWTAGAEGLEWLAEGASAPTACTWRDMAEVLTGVQPGLRCGFYLLGRMPKDEAVGSSEQLVERAAETYAALMPLYAASAR
jgi:hypothetical protein